MNIINDPQLNAVLVRTVNDINSIVAKRVQDALAAVTGSASLPVAAATSTVSAPRPARKPVAKKPVKPAKPTKAPTTAAKPAKTAARAPGEKRSPQEIAKLRERISNHIKKHPKQRVEEISKALGVPTKEMNLVLVQLKRTGAVTTEGQKRAMTYTWNTAASTPAAG